jgi:hypothetical protein
MKKDHAQENFERLSYLMADKAVRHEAFELLADLHPARIRAEAMQEAADRAEKWYREKEYQEDMSALSESRIGQLRARVAELEGALHGLLVCFDSETGNCLKQRASYDKLDTARAALKGGK